MISEKNSRELRIVRHDRLRKHVRGTSDRPRLSVFRSLNHIYVQIIDDTKGLTLVAASSKDKEIAPSKNKARKQELSRQVGSLIAKKAKEQGITKVVMDRGGYKYHGRIKVLADAAREGGLKF